MAWLQAARDWPRPPASLDSACHTVARGVTAARLTLEHPQTNAVLRVVQGTPRTSEIARVSWCATLVVLKHTEGTIAEMLAVDKDAERIHAKMRQGHACKFE